MSIKPHAAEQPLKAHLSASIKLGLPLIGTFLASMLMGVTDTLMVGRLGAEPLAASVLANQLFFFLTIAGIGLASAIMPMAATALGRDDITSMRRAVRMGFWAALLYAVIVMPIMFLAEPIFTFLKQADPLPAMAQSYLDIAMWSLIPTMIVMVLRSYLSVVGLANMVLLITLSAAGLNALLNYAFIFGNWGMPAMGLRGAAVATLGSASLSAIVLLVFAASKKSLRGHELFVRWWRPDWPAFVRVIRLGWPIALSLVAEISLFGFSAIMVGWFGILALAAHGIVLQIISMAFMIPLGLSQVGTIRIGLAKGHENNLEIAQAGKAVYILGLVMSFATILVLVLLPQTLVNIFIGKDSPDAAEILFYAIPFLAIAAAFQLVDSLQVLSAGLLRGLSDTRVPMQIAIFAYWVIGVPMAYVLSNYTALAANGVWTGLAIGLAVAAVLSTRRYIKREALGLV
ncbi:MAG: MATE family efflux transporter [Rhodobacteraceae bacterium]|nr:MATE family efflux transporter [Paracoccaceae bacterium]